MKISEILKNNRTVTLDILKEKTGLSKGYLSRLEKGDFDNQKISLDTVIRIAKGLDLKVGDVLDEMGIIEKSSTMQSLRVYLKNRYDIVNSADVELINQVIKKIKK